MSVRENIRTSLLWQMGFGYGFWQNVERNTDLNDRTDTILEEVSLAHRAQTEAGTLSYADQRLLEVGITLAGNPKIILLDEPTAGMSNSESADVVKLLKKISKERTLIIIEHDISVIMGLADKVAVLVYGKVIANDSPEIIRKNSEVRMAYLGQGNEADA